jgi:hypothetical protein
MGERERKGKMGKSKGGGEINKSEKINKMNLHKFWQRVLATGLRTLT